jgi:hypothetical protein
VNKALSHRLDRLESRLRPQFVALYWWNLPDGGGSIGTREGAKSQGITDIHELLPNRELRRQRIADGNEATDNAFEEMSRRTVGDLPE